MYNQLEDIDQDMDQDQDQSKHLDPEIVAELELFAKEDGIDPEVLFDLEILANDDTDKGREARYYIEYGRYTGDVEWVPGFGTINVRDRCESKQESLKNFLLLCKDKIVFETVFKNAWEIEYNATFYDEIVLDSLTLLGCENQSDFVELSFNLSSRFKKQVENLEFGTFFLRTIFDKIAQSLSADDFSISWVNWQHLITLCLHPTQGDKVLLILNTFSFQTILTNRDFRNGTLGALGSYNTFLLSSKSKLEQLLEFLQIPKITSAELILECFQKKNFKPIVAFLEKNDWFDKSCFSGPPTKIQQEIILLKKHIAFLKNNAPARETFAKTFTELFQQNQAALAESNIFDALASFEADAMKIAPFSLRASLFQIKQDVFLKEDPESLFQIKQDLLIKEDPALFEIAEMFLKQIYRENEIFEKFQLSKTIVFSRDLEEDGAFSLWAKMIKIFMVARREKLHDQKVDKLQDALEKYQLRWLFFFKTKLNKKNLVFPPSGHYAMP